MREIEQRLKDFIAIFEPYLESCLPKDESLPQKTVLDAMRYSLLSGGKRIRPFVLASFCVSCGGSIESALPFAAAVEMIHTYSLIHDDLPCMDNDSLRRGKPTSHIVYGEAGAVLAGDGLLNLAAETALAGGMKTGLPADRIVKALSVIFEASGWQGMLGGQIVDMESEGKSISYNQLRLMHALKTGALIKAAATAGCIVGGGTEQQTTEAGTYAEKLGLVFQIIDDILDVTGNTALLGKNTGSDQDNQKTTYVSLLGLEEAKKASEEFSRQAIQALISFADAENYGKLVDYLLRREN